MAFRQNRRNVYFPRLFYGPPLPQACGRMRLRLYLMFLVVPLAAGGCRAARLNQETLERENRKLEDKIFEIEGDIEDLKDELESCRRENERAGAREKSGRGQSSRRDNDSRGTRDEDGDDDRLRFRTPRATDEAPRDQDLPDVEAPDLDVPSAVIPDSETRNREQAPPFAGPPEISPPGPDFVEGIKTPAISQDATSAQPPGRLPQAQLRPIPLDAGSREDPTAAADLPPESGSPAEAEKAEDPSISGTERSLEIVDPAAKPGDGGSDVPSAAAGQSGKVASITLNSTLTGKSVSGAKSGTRGFLAVVEPRDHEGRLVQELGEVSVVVMDHSRPGVTGRLARWDFTAEAVAAFYKRAAQAEGVFLDLTWPAPPPVGRPLTVYVRMTTTAGEKLTAEHSFELPAVAAAPQREMHRPPQAAAKRRAAPRRKSAPSAARARTGQVPASSGPAPPWPKNSSAAPTSRL